MAISQPAKVSIIPLAAALMLLFAGAAQAWNCAPGYIDCNACVNPQTDVNNCGKCGTKCIAPPNASAKCYNGKCEYTCNAGWKNCDGKWETGCEAEVSKDANNCGSCGTKCSPADNATPKCNNQKCDYTCNSGFKNCDNSWTNGCECAPDTDVDHCGGCGNKCPQPKYFGGEARCTYGKCETQSCKKGMKYDGGKGCCVNGDGGNNGGDNGGNNGGDNGGGNGGNWGWGGDKGGSKGGDKGGDKGGSKGGNKGGHGGGW